MRPDAVTDSLVNKLSPCKRLLNKQPQPDHNVLASIAASFSATYFVLCSAKCFACSLTIAETAIGCKQRFRSSSCLSVCTACMYPHLHQHLLIVRAVSMGMFSRVNTFQWAKLLHPYRAGGQDPQTRPGCNSSLPGAALQALPQGVMEWQL